MTKVFQIPLFVTGVKTTADKALELKLHTRDLKSFTPEQLGTLMGMYEKEYWVAFSELPVEADQIKITDERVDKGERTPAQRLRAVLYRLWEQGKREQDSETFYRAKMENIINQFKEKLE